MSRSLVLANSSCDQVLQRLLQLPLDHFNVFNRDKFDVRYFVNGQHWIPGGVIFIYVTNGGYENYENFLTQGLIYELAEETNGYLFSIEQRFFGESHPTGDHSTENLRFLTNEQSIADLAVFVNFIKNNYYGASNSRVVLWGRGYGANLAVWTRQKYPHLVDACFASSAPINTVLEAPEIVSHPFHILNSVGGKECGDVITGAMNTIENAIRWRNTSEIEDRLRLCQRLDLGLEENIAHFFFRITDEISNFVSDSSYTEIDVACTKLRGLDHSENEDESDFVRFARWFSDDLLSKLECLEYDRQANWDLVRNEDNDDNYISARNMLWMYCLGFGHFETANRGEGHPFGSRFEIDLFVERCAYVFGHDIMTKEFMEESINYNNVVFGGLNPNVYRTFFTYGEMDPRISLGPKNDLNDLAPVVVMPLQSRARDLGSPSETDYIVLRETKERVRQTLIKWIFDSMEEQLRRHM